MTDRHPHPLTLWLDQTGEQAYQFANRLGIAPSTLYRVLNGAQVDPGVLLLTQIMHGTGRAVTVGAMTQWLIEERTQHGATEERADGAGGTERSPATPPAQQRSAG